MTCSATSKMVTDATKDAASLSVYCSKFEVVSGDNKDAALLSIASLTWRAMMDSFASAARYAPLIIDTTTPSLITVIIASN